MKNLLADLTRRNYLKSKSDVFFILNFYEFINY